MSRWQSLERWSPRAFLVAGALLTVFAALVALEVFGGVNAPQALVAIPALVAGIVGLFGLYPPLADEDSRFALGGVVALSIAVVGLVALLLWVASLTAMYGIDSVKPPAPVILSTILLTILGYALIGIASVRQAVPSRTVGLLVLVPPGTLVLMESTNILYGGNPPEWTAFVFSGMQAVAHLSIGYLLWTNGMPADSAESVAETTA